MTQFVDDSLYHVFLYIHPAILHRTINLVSKQFYDVCKNIPRPSNEDYYAYLMSSGYEVKAKRITDRMRVRSGKAKYIAGCKGNSYDLMVCAIETGDKRIIKILLKLYPLLEDMRWKKESREVLFASMKRDDIDIYEYILEVIKFDEKYIFAEAANAGRLDIMRKMYNEGDPIKPKHYMSAMRSGNIDMLWWMADKLHDEACFWLCKTKTLTINTYYLL